MDSNCCLLFLQSSHMAHAIVQGSGGTTAKNYCYHSRPFPADMASELFHATTVELSVVFVFISAPVILHTLTYSIRGC